jgi:hypothetical protein
MLPLSKKRRVTSKGGLKHLEHIFPNDPNKHVVKFNRWHSVETFFSSAAHLRQLPVQDRRLGHKNNSSVEKGSSQKPAFGLG